MKQFRIKENGFKEIRKRTLIRTIPIVIIAAAIGLLISDINLSNNNASNINVLPYVIPIIIGALVLGLNKGLKRQKTIYDTYELKVDDNSITREQANTPTIILLFTDIKKITKTNQGGLVISGNSTNNSILVPEQIDDLKSLESILRENCTAPISFEKPLIQRLRIPIVLAVFGLMTLTYISKNKLLVASGGSILTTIMIWSFILIQKNRNIDKRTRKSSYWIILVIISIIGTMIFKLMNIV